MLAAAGWRGTPARGRRAPRPVLRLGDDRDRGGADRHGPRPGAAAPVRVRAAAAVRRRRAARRAAAPASRRPRRACARRAVPIFASDVSFRMVDFARRNAERAGVADAIVFHGGDALERPAPRAARRAARHADGQPAVRRADRGRRQGAQRRARAATRATTGERRRPPRDEASRSDRDAPSDFFAAPGRALEARLHRAPGRLDGVDPEPRHAPAERDAAEGVAPRADVERADRVPPVPLRPRRRLGARRREGA